MASTFTPALLAQDHENLRSVTETSVYSILPWKLKGVTAVHWPPEERHDGDDEDAGHRKHCKASGVRSREVSEDAQCRGHQESADPPRRADQPRDGADLPSEPLRHDLNDHPVSHSQTHHREKDRGERER